MPRSLRGNKEIAKLPSRVTDSHSYGSGVGM
ncbi:hypothetical protein FRC0104_02368 [Corynebacterium diphtheriae]|nr:hypothetical protein FRC0104_02368 [Corynebacterium diphtheriae]